MKTILTAFLVSLSLTACGGPDLVAERCDRDATCGMLNLAPRDACIAQRHEALSQLDVDAFDAAEAVTTYCLDAQSCETYRNCIISDGNVYVPGGRR